MIFSAILIFAVAGFRVAAPLPGHAAAPGLAAAEPLAPEEAGKIARQAFTFAYPLVLVEMTRRATTLGGSPQVLNRFRHEPAFPDDPFRQVITPNADTLC